MKTILAALLACLLAGSVEAQHATITRDRWFALLNEDWSHGCRLWREGRITVEQYAKWRDDAWNEMVQKYGNPPQEPPRAYIKSQEQIELERISRELRNLQQEIQRQNANRSR